MCDFHKYRETLRDKQVEQLIELISLDTINVVASLNEETTLKHHGNTHCGLRYGGLLSIIKLCSPVIDVIVELRQDTSDACIKH